MLGSHYSHAVPNKSDYHWVAFRTFVVIMSIDLGNLQVERLIIHQIPRRMAKESASLRVTDVENELSQEDKNFFSERIKGSLTKSSHEIGVREESSEPSPVPKHVFEIFLDDTKFVALSQSIAAHLYQCQTGVNPAGILVVSQLKIATKPALAILKLEKEEGMKFEPKVNEEGLIECSIEQLSNLMLTGGKVFKVGLFIKESEEITDMAGYVSDKQSADSVAKFFLEDFLGCYFLESSEKTTKKFFEASQDFINNLVEKPATKAKYEMAFLSTLRNNRETIEPTNFANDYLELEDRQKFISHLTENRIPTNSFKKNTNSIRNKIKNMHLFFKDTSVSVSGDPDSFEDIEIQDIGHGKVKVSFKAELEKIGK